MFKRMLRSSLVVFALVTLFSISSAEEGMWLLDRLDQLPIDSLKAMGLKLAPEQIYDPKDGGIFQAVVKVNGGTGAFVSPEGLIITNHHVAFDAVQRQSSPEHNYLEHGFYAPTKEEEFPAIGYDVYVTESFQDVSQKVLSAISEKMSDLERYKAIEKISKEIIQECEKGKDVKCRVVSMYEGSQYYLFTYFKIRDVRIVYVPPNSIGDYGGETDNWMWPRHAGDFAFLRAYVAPNGSFADYSKENVPYHPKTYLSLSTSGVKEGDFVILLGFPGRTRRYENCFSIEKMIMHDYPKDIQTRKDLILILEGASAEDSSTAIKLSSRIKGLNNYLKKNQGMLEGFERAKILEKKIEEERSLAKFLNENPKFRKIYGNILSELDSLLKEYRRFEDKEFILDWMSNYCVSLDFASTIYKWSIEKEKKDQDREPGYQNRDTLEIKQWLKDAQVNLVPSVDKKILIYFLKKAIDLPTDQKIEAIEELFKGMQGQGIIQILEQFTDELYKRTKLGSQEERLKMFGLSKEELKQLNDPFIDFASKLEEEKEKLRERRKKFSGALTRLKPKLISAYAEWKRHPLYPDANGTIRFNYGTVQGYSPKDAVSFRYITTLTGVMEKNTHQEPFDVPPELEKAYRKRDFGIYLDSLIGDVPVNFLSTNDITNGNSGSPILNGRGELLGLAFDGNYESISADYLFEPKITRAINVDIRYVLFILDKVYHKEGLLKELTIVK